MIDSPSKSVKKKSREKFSVFLILMVVVPLCLVLAVAGRLLYGKTLENAERENSDVNIAAAAALDIFFSGIHGGAMLMLEAADLNTSLGDGAPSIFFNNYPRIAAAALYRYPDDRNPTVSFVNGKFFRDNNADPRLPEIFTELRKDALEAARQNRSTLLNCESIFGFPLFALFFPYAGGRTASAGVVFFSTADLDRYFSPGPRITYLVSITGDALLHSGLAPRSGENISATPFFRTMLLSQHENGRLRYTSAAGKKTAGAYSKLTSASAVLVTESPYHEVFSGLVYAGIRAACAAVIVMIFSTLIALSSTKTIRASLKKAKTLDEVNLKLETVSRYADMELARLCMGGMLPAGAAYRKASVLLSGIESFTGIAEQLNPVEALSLLNDYVGRAAACVKKTDGTLERFSDGVIKAYWGVHSSTGSVEHDALNCIRSALMMRVAVHEINRERAAIGLPCLKLCCGISSGEFAAGTADCGWRTDYALIGKALEFAEIAKMQNYFLDTDILITESTWRLAKKYIVAEEISLLKIEGREKPLRLYALINIRTQRGEAQVFPASLDDVRFLYSLEYYQPPSELKDTGVAELEEL
ncbi:MAG: adenylate/guanylate cyclase domain-containing protein [Spirochaetaceae bacterium]|jgi:adenylate cyclase|nr:adenylate/guanylate cyclase domain-containing protein [Spirochaetaceae bacterium]